MLSVCLTLIDDDEDEKSFERLVKKYEKKLYNESFNGKITPTPFFFTFD